MELGQFVHTDYGLQSKRVTSIEIKTSKTYDVTMKLYEDDPRVTSPEYIQISIYTKTFFFQSSTLSVSQVLQAVSGQSSGQTVTADEAGSDSNCTNENGTVVEIDDANSSAEGLRKPDFVACNLPLQTMKKST